MENLLSLEAAQDFVRQEKAAGHKVVFTNGCFDIIHAGHVRYLAAARAEGDALIVGLNSDASVRRLKGESRPINGELDRAEVLLALKAVDKVTIFSEDTATATITALKPDIYVKGADYTLKTLPEAAIVHGYGGKVAFVPLVAGRSTSAIVESIRQKAKKESK